MKCFNTDFKGTLQCMPKLICLSSVEVILGKKYITRLTRHGGVTT